MHSRVSRLALALSTMGPIGYLKAPGTMATLATLPCMLFFKTFFSHHLYFLIVVGSALIGFYCIKYSLCHFLEADPSAIVIDEFVGCFVTFLFLPLSFFSVLVGFALFRFFDISKCLGVRYCESFGGAGGVLLDDVFAGVLANITLQIITISCLL